MLNDNEVFITIDIDGCFAGHTQENGHWEYTLKKENVQNLTYALSLFDKDFWTGVLSSTWRRDRERIFELRRFSPTLAWFTREKTGVRQDGRRGLEIQDFLESTGYPRDYNRIIVIDDDSEDIVPYISRNNFIHTRHDDGFTLENAERMIAMLDSFGIPRRE